MTNSSEQTGFEFNNQSSVLNIDDIKALLPDALSDVSDKMSVGISGDSQYELTWEEDIQFTQLFGVDNFLVDVSVSNSTLLVTTDEDNGNSFEFTGDITVGSEAASETFGITSSFSESENQLTWNEVSIDDFSFESFASELGGGVEEVTDFLGDLGDIDVNLTKDDAGEVDFAASSDIVSFEYTGENEFEVNVQGINFTNLFNVDNFLPDLTINQATFTSSKEDDTTNYDFSGDITFASETFGFSTKFLEADSELNWTEIEITDFDVNVLFSEIPGLKPVNNFLGDLADVDVNLTKDDAGEVDFAASSDDFNFEYTSEGEFEFNLTEDINFTNLFNVGSFLPDLIINQATFTSSVEGDTTNYDFYGDITFASETFGFSTKFLETDSNLNWTEIEITDFDVNVLFSEIPGLKPVNNFLGDLADVDINLTKDDAGEVDFAASSDDFNFEYTAEGEFEFNLTEDINFTNLFSVGSFLPDLIINQATFTSSVEGDTTNYDFSGDITFASETFGFSTKFLEADSNLNWTEIEITDFDVNVLFSEIPGLKPVNNFLGDLADVDVNLTKDDAGEVDFAASSDDFNFEYTAEGEFEFNLTEDINFTNLFNVGSFLPDLIISDATFTSSKEGDTTNYDFYGDITFASETFGFSTTFLETDSNLSWNQVSITEFDIDALLDEIPGLKQVNNFLGGLGDIDLTFTKDDGGEVDFTAIADDFSIEYTGENEFEVALTTDINFAELFNVDSVLPDLTISDATFTSSVENDVTNYDFSGDITFASETFGFSTNFLDTDSNLSWNQVSITEFDIDALLDEIPGLKQVNKFLGGLGDIDLTFTKDEEGGVDFAASSDEISFEYTGDGEFAVTLTEQINFTKLFNVGNFLPNIKISDATFASIDDTFEFSGEVTIAGESFTIASSFNQGSNNSGLSWNEVSIEDFNLSSLGSWLGGGASKVNDIFGSALPDIDLTISQDEISFGGEINFANSNDKYLNWISGQLGIDELGVSFSYNKSRDISLEASLGGNISLFSSNKFSATLNDVVLGFSLSGTDLEPSFLIEAGLGLEIAGDKLDLTGGISLEPESITGYFALESEEGWENPFGIPDATLRNVGFQIGATYAPPFIDNIGIIGDLQFGDYDIASAVLFDTNDVDNFALVSTLNEPLSLLDLLTGPVASYALKQAGNKVGAINNVTNLLDNILDVTIESIDTDGDGENDPLISIVPTATTIAGIEIEEGFGVNGAINAWGQEGLIYLNANQSDGSINGGLELEKIDIGNGILVVEGNNGEDVNFDLSVSALETSFGGSAKVTFLGQELLDIDFAASQSGLEFAYTSDGIIQSALSVTLDDSGFAANGSMDFDVDFDVNLGSLGTVSIDASLNSYAEMSFDADGFNGSIDGSVDVYGETINFSLSLDVPPSDLSKLYDLIVDDIASAVKNAATSIFADVSEWANAVANGVVDASEDVANVAKNVYGAGEQAAINAYKTIGGTSTDVANGLRNTYRKTQGQITNLLKNNGYSLNDVGDALKDVYNLGSNAMANQLKQFYGVTGVGNYLKNSYRLSSSQMTNALKGAGYGLNDVGNYLKSGYRLSSSQMTNVLKGAGYGLNSVGNYLKSGYRLSSSQMTSVLKGANYGLNDVGNYLKNSYRLSSSQMTNVLKGAGYGLNSVGNYLKSGYRLSSSQMTNVLKGANYGLNDVGNYLKSGYRLSSNSMASVLKGASYGLNDVGNYLKNGYRLSSSQMTSVLKGAGYGLNDVGNYLKSGYRLSSSSMTSVLKGAGYGLNDIGNFLESSYRLSAKDISKALKSVGFDTDDVGDFLRKDLGLSKNDALKTLKKAGFSGSSVKKLAKKFGFKKWWKF